MPAVRKAVRSISHEDRLSLFEHLDELRTRLMIMGLTIVVAFSICAWQNKALLDFIGKPLATQTEQRTEDGKGLPGQIYTAYKGIRAVQQQQVADLTTLRQDRTLAPSSRRAFARQLATAKRNLAALPKGAPPNKPVTIGIGEPFTQTITVAAYFALLFSLPFLLFQLYAFVLPAFSPDERRVALPLMAMVPFLFAAGVAFAYVVVLPAATAFLQNFNADQFNVLVQAKDYYKFAVLTLASIGLVFQLPVFILALTRTGIVTAKQLRGYRRYAIVTTSVIAMVLPGTDPVSMILEFLILYALFEFSLIMSAIMDRGQPERVSRFSQWRDDRDDDEDEDDEDDLDDDDLGPGGSGIQPDPEDDPDDDDAGEGEDEDWLLEAAQGRRPWPNQRPTDGDDEDPDRTVLTPSRDGDG